MFQCFAKVLHNYTAKNRLALTGAPVIGDKHVFLLFLCSFSSHLVMLSTTSVLCPRFSAVLNTIGKIHIHRSFVELILVGGFGGI